MNVFGFGSNGTDSDVDKFDCNFISVYNSQEDDFDYFVERLCGLSIHNQIDPGCLWHVYINGALEDWTTICRFGRVVRPADTIEWKFHSPVESVKSEE